MKYFLHTHMHHLQFSARSHLVYPESVVFSAWPKIMKVNYFKPLLRLQPKFQLLKFLETVVKIVDMLIWPGET